MSSPLVRQLTLLMLLAPLSYFLLAACGGAATDSDSGSAVALSGRLLFPKPIFEDAWYLDLSTGHYRPVPYLVWGDDEDTLCDDSTYFSVVPVRGSDRLLESRIDCEHTADDEVYGQYSQFTLRDGAVKFIDGFVVLLLPGDFLFGPARLSPDGSRVAISGSYTGDRASFHLQLFSFDGDWLAVSNEGDVTDEDFVWLPDNRLLYASGQTLYITPPKSVAGEPWLTFDEVEGEPMQLSLSPDGKQLALTLVSNRLSGVSVYGDIWVVDLETRERRRVVYAPEADMLNYPIFSPDGRWIGFIQNVASTANHLATTRYYIVPSDGEDIQLTAKGVSNGIQLRTWVSDVTGTSPEYASRFLRDAPIAWLP